MATNHLFVEADMNSQSIYPRNWNMVPAPFPVPALGRPHPSLRIYGSVCVDDEATSVGQFPPGEIAQAHEFVEHPTKAARAVVMI